MEASVREYVPYARDGRACEKWEGKRRLSALATATHVLLEPPRTLLVLQLSLGLLEATVHKGPSHCAVIRRALSPE